MGTHTLRTMPKGEGMSQEIPSLLSLCSLGGSLATYFGDQFSYSASRGLSQSQMCAAQEPCSCWAVQEAPHITAPPSSASSLFVPVLHLVLSLPAGAENKHPLKMLMRPHFLFCLQGFTETRTSSGHSCSRQTWGAPALPNTHAASSGSAPGHRWVGSP